MLRIALVGNIASGKSTVEEYLKTEGYFVLDTDKVCHELLVCDEITKAFAEYDIFENGTISREKLGQLVFSNPKLKQMLEDILYPKVVIAIEEYFKKNSLETIVFVAIPLMFEAGMRHLFDKVLFTYCDDNLRLNRLIKRNNYTEEYAKIRINAQMSQEDKVKESDFILYNNSSIEDLYNQLNVVLEQLISLEK